jgi:CubicO group peptidase (beta-lactamase class C family)
MVMRLIERHRVALADPIGQHLPQLPPKWRAVTVLQLLNHTSGIPDFTEKGNRWARHWSEAMSPEALIAIVADDAMDFAPGSKWKYTNTGYLILGMLVEKLYARSYDDILEQEFSKPFGLDHTRNCEDTAGANGQARGYNPASLDGSGKDNRLVPIKYRHISHSLGAGSICSTVGDLAVWNRALHGGGVLSPPSYSLMTTPQGAAVSEGYGFGLKVQSLAGHRMLVHSGAMGGFVTVNGCFRRLAVGIVLAIRCRYLKRFSSAILPTLPPFRHGVRSCDRVSRQVGSASLCGPPRSWCRTTAQHRFWEDDGSCCQADGRGAMLRRIGEDAFGTALDPTVKVTFIVEHGIVTKMIFEQAGRRFDSVKR